jgi:hypothetical protein
MLVSRRGCAREKEAAMETVPDLPTTRRALHGVAELVLAGPQHEARRTVRLRVVPGGFATSVGDDVRLDGTTLRRGDLSVAVDGATPEALAHALGLRAQRLDEVYADGTDVGLDEILRVDPGATRELTDAWSIGDEALRRVDPGQAPVLWPEHFDVGIAVGEVNYGVSPGDQTIPVPYAYVGPWTVPSGDSFWNQPFGAARTIADLGTADAVLAFFEEGRRRTER